MWDKHGHVVISAVCRKSPIREVKNRVYGKREIRVYVFSKNRVLGRE